MQVEFVYHGKTYPVVIEKKRTTKHIYMKVKDDLTVFVTCNTLTKEKTIEKLLMENHEKIENMLAVKEKHKKEDAEFYFLGKHYDIVYQNQVPFQLGETKVFMERDYPIDKWLKKQALVLFRERLDICYQNFSRTIPYPTLRIRKMKTRWGVCNTRDIVITLNLDLIRKEIKYLDYVIYHELAHLIYPNHSKDFWRLVEENCAHSKQCRRELNA